MTKALRIEYCRLKIEKKKDTHRSPGKRRRGLKRNLPARLIARLNDIVGQVE
ncbi:MAG: hypothetical protein ACUZ8N_07345 [Candidatus Scalindua sp.]